MGNQLRALLLGVAFVLLSGGGWEVYACSCTSEPPACEAFGGVSAVFVGRVVGAAQQKTYELDGTKETFDVGSVHFAVEEAFSGVKGRGRVTVHSGTSGADCGYWFRRGVRYVVYAYGDEKGKLYTNICTRTRRVEDAAEDLAFLRALPPEGTGVRLYGTVEKPAEARPGSAAGDKTEGLAGITITVSDAAGRRRETVTDGEGRYEFAGLKAGEYEVSAALPDYYHKGNMVSKVEVYDRGCAEASFFAVADGRVAGRVVDAAGKPPREVKVVLIPASARGRLTMRDEVRADYLQEKDAGQFDLTQVPPGEYLLGVNLTFSPDEDEPYPPTYYPGVGDPSAATVVRVGLGQKMTDLVLRLPPRLVERTVQGVVVWPDGTPAAGAEVHLTDHRHPGWIANGAAKTDAAGRFTLKGFDGITYWVLADAFKSPDAPYAERQPMHAEPPSVTLHHDVSGLKLMLASEGSLCKHYYQEKPDE